ncbi:MAG: sugar ABC transporter permease [Trueperaceae bacterium]|nr:sugar ABC transporter permease [Trueperaceae bacterium]
MDNYARVFRSTLFWRDFGRSVIYTFGSVTLFFFVGFAVALSLAKIDRFVTVVRGISLLPWAIPPVTAAMMWRWTLDTEYGLVNDVLQRIGLEPVGWLTKGPTAMSVLIFTDAWIRIPFVALILYAGLQSIPVEFYESASIDGASAFQRLRYITLPNLRYPSRSCLRCRRCSRSAPLTSSPS